MEKTVTAFTALKSLISRGSREGHDTADSGLYTPRNDVRGPVVTPIRSAVTPCRSGVNREDGFDIRIGASLISIAREHRLGKEKVRDLFTKAGVRIRRQDLDEKQVAHAVCRYKEGHAVREVAREMGVGHSMAWRALKKAGVKLCSRSQTTNTK